MDKIKITLAVLQKHHFWLLCLVILSLSLLSWSKAANDMSAHFAKRKTDLQNKTTKVVSIGADVKHPNDKTIRGIQSRHGVSTDPSAPNEKNNLVDNVREVWKRLYAEQRDQNPLPKALVQKEGFQREFDKRWGPLEKLGPSDEMDPKYRDTFLYHIKEHFPTLFRIIDRRQEVNEDGTPVDTGNRSRGGMGTAAGGAGQAGVRMEGIVDWDEVDAQRLISRFTQWRTTPSTLDVMLAQEDLWVYEALLRVIRNTNNTSPDDRKYIKPIDHRAAAVKRIRALEIGQDAVQVWEASQQPVALLGSQAAGGAAGGPMGAGAAGVNPLAHGASGPGGTAEKSPLAGRYVDDKGKPLADPTQQPYAEFRMMPIDLQVIIEQKAIPKLLAECANSNMPIEVRAVRVLAKDSEPFDLGEGGSGGGSSPQGPRLGSGAAGHLPGAGRPGAPPGPMGLGGAAENQEDEALDPAVPPIPVEIRGIIYIYNPPDRSRLGTGTAGGSVAAATGASAKQAAPVVPPATPAPAPAPVPARAPAVSPAPAPGVPPGPGAPPAAAPAPAAPAGAPSAKGGRP
ncbi:MAG: hypothetical protein ABSF26_26835 [Thermoguttaceae bacterium]|jgi:hypothetical protein